MNATFSSGLSSGVEKRNEREPSLLVAAPVNITGQVMAFKVKGCEAVQVAQANGLHVSPALNAAPQMDQNGTSESSTRPVSSQGAAAGVTGFVGPVTGLPG